MASMLQETGDRVLLETGDRLLLDQLPTPLTVFPQSVFVGDALNVTITGYGFSAASTVDFDGTPATNVVFVDENTLTCDVPAHVAGPSVITVTNP